jgi:hypothetical protein
MAILWLPEIAAAAGPAAAPIVIVADTRNLTGFRAWWANLYNESHVYFTVLTYICILVMGLSLAGLADVVMKRIGIDLKSRELAEH